MVEKYITPRPENTFECTHITGKTHNTIIERQMYWYRKILQHYKWFYKDKDNNFKWSDKHLDIRKRHSEWYPNDSGSFLVDFKTKYLNLNV